MQENFLKKLLAFLLLLNVTIAAFAQSGDPLPQKITYPELPFVLQLPSSFKLQPLVSPTNPENIYAYATNAGATDGSRPYKVKVYTQHKYMSINNIWTNDIQDVINSTIYNNSDWNASKTPAPIIQKRYNIQAIPFSWVTATCKTFSAGNKSVEKPIVVALAIYDFAEYRITITSSFETNDTTAYLKLAESISKSIKFSLHPYLARMSISKMYDWKPKHLLETPFSFCIPKIWQPVYEGLANNGLAMYSFEDSSVLLVKLYSKPKDQTDDDYAKTVKANFFKWLVASKSASFDIQKKKNAIGLTYYILPFTTNIKSRKISVNEYLFALNDTLFLHIRATLEPPKNAAPSSLVQLREKSIQAIMETIDIAGTRVESAKDKFNFLIPTGWKIDERSSEELIAFLPQKETDKEPPFFIKKIPKTSNVTVTSAVEGIIKEIKSDPIDESVIEQETIKTTFGEIKIINATITSSFGSKSFDTYAVFEKGKNIVIVKISALRFTKTEYSNTFEKQVATILLYNP
jgi:hypothetical protein